MARHIEGPWFRDSKNTWYSTFQGKKVSLAVKGEENQKEAERAWHRLMAEETPGNGPSMAQKRQGEAKRKEDRLTLQGFVDAFLLDAENRLKANTVRIYRYDLGSLCDVHGKVQVDTLTPAQLTLWLHRLKVNSTTKAMTLRSVSACLGWGERNGLILANPAKRVPKPKSHSRTSEAVISEVGHNRLLEKATPDFRLVLRVLHGTGCRPGEASRMSAENFDATNGVVVLNEHKSDRSGKPRLIFLPPSLVELLKTQVEKFKRGQLLRSNKGVAWTGRSITQAMRRLKKKAGVKTIAYGYRHGFATSALSKGVPDAHVASLLGHSSTAMLHRHYSHLTSQTRVLRSAVEQVRE